MRWERPVAERGVHAETHKAALDWSQICVVAVGVDGKVLDNEYETQCLRHFHKDATPTEQMIRNSMVIHTVSSQLHIHLPISADGALPLTQNFRSKLLSYISVRIFNDFFSAASKSSSRALLDAFFRSLTVSVAGCLLPALLLAIRYALRASNWRASHLL